LVLLPPGKVVLPPPVKAVPAVGVPKVILSTPLLPLRVAVSVSVFATQPEIATQFTSVLPKSRLPLIEKFAAAAGLPSSANKAITDVAETNKRFISLPLRSLYRIVVLFLAHAGRVPKNYFARDQVSYKSPDRHSEKCKIFRQNGDEPAFPSAPALHFAPTRIAGVAGAVWEGSPNRTIFHARAARLATPFPPVSRFAYDRFRLRVNTLILCKDLAGIVNPA